MKVVTCALICSILTISEFASVSAKRYTKCSLAREMHRLGVPKSELPDWMCIAKYESSFNTAAIGPANKNGSKDWGIFQINDKYWCKPPNGKSHNSCKVACRTLLSDNVAASVKCARQIKRQQGFKAWVAWKNKCQRGKESVNNCF